MLTDTQKRQLLETARKSMTEYVKSRKRLKAQTTDSVLSEFRGAFVTLTKNGVLRGCIGRIAADIPLINVVNEMAIEAATGDPRFPQVSSNELDNIHIEISALSPITIIKNIDEIKVGTHGLIIRKGFNSGLLLPQVATEYNWTKEEFLQHTCLKAGLGINDWKKGAEISIFSAEVFGE